MGLFRKIKLSLEKPIQIKNFTSKEILIRAKIGGNIDIDRKLIVPEGFICYLVAKEKVCDKFMQGEHKLSIDNLPILTRTVKLNVPNKKGKYKNSFFADIYFLNLNEIENQKFESEEGIYIRKDKQFLGLTCFVKGEYNFKLSNPNLFLEAMLKVYGLINNGLAQKQIAIWTGELVDKKISKNKPSVEEINERDSGCFDGLLEYLNKNTRDIGIEYLKADVLETILPKKIYKTTKLDYVEKYNKEKDREQNNFQKISNDIDDNREKIDKIKEQKQISAKSDEDVATDGISFFDDIENFDKSNNNWEAEDISQIKETKTFDDTSTNDNYVISKNDLSENQNIETESNETAEEMQNKIAYKKCKHCGAINSKDAENCFECHNEFKKICQHCGAEISNGDFVCPKCKSVVI